MAEGGELLGYMACIQAVIGVVVRCAGVTIFDPPPSGKLGLEGITDKDFQGMSAHKLRPNSKWFTKLPLILIIINMKKLTEIETKEDNVLK